MVVELPLRGRLKWFGRRAICSRATVTEPMHRIGAYGFGYSLDNKLRGGVVMCTMLSMRSEREEVEFSNFGDTEFAFDWPLKMLNHREFVF